MKTDQRRILSGFLFCFLVGLSACTSVHKPTGFLADYSELKKGEHFRQEFVRPDADFTRYQKVKVDPVELKYFDSPHEKYSQEELERLASHLKIALETELGKKYKVMGAEEPPDSRTFIVKSALVYVDSPERLVNLATFWLIGFGFSKGSAAFEAKLLDGASGREIADAAERRKSGGGLTDIRSLLIGGWFRFVNAEGAFKRWGKELREVTEGKMRKGGDGK